MPCQAHWYSPGGSAPPRRIVLVNDGVTADAAFRLAAEGTALLWRGDFHNAGQLLRAIRQRIDRRAGKRDATAPITGEGFHRFRLLRAQRAQLLGKLLIPFDAEGRIPLRRAPDVQDACRAALALPGEAFLLSLRELQGVIGAYEWRQKGVYVEGLGARIHPHYGVFSPVRGEYVELVAKVPLPERSALGFDIGTGTGVLALVLARRGVKVVATDVEQRALACATENILRLGMADKVQVVHADMFPRGMAGLVVCNPPWLPGSARTPLERAVYDPDSGMLRAFLAGLRDHLAPGGEGWLILSDLAEHLGLRARDTLMQWIAAGGLRVVGRLDARPTHPRANDPTDPLHAARQHETTSLWRLAAV